MSTQKRENRPAPATRICRVASRFSSAARMRRPGDTRRRRQRPHKGTNRAGARGSMSLALWARNSSAGLGGSTAPHLLIVWSIWCWMATSFLLEDKPLRLPVRPAAKAERPGSPPFLSPVCGLPASPGHPAIPFPSSHLSLLPRLPQAPAKIRRAERYDGQRNLHFLHAA